MISNIEDYITVIRQPGTLRRTVSAKSGALTQSEAPIRLHVTTPRRFPRRPQAAWIHRKTEGETQGGGSRDLKRLQDGCMTVTYRAFCCLSSRTSACFGDSMTWCRGDSASAPCWLRSGDPKKSCSDRTAPLPANAIVNFNLLVTLSDKYGPWDYTADSN